MATINKHHLAIFKKMVESGYTDTRRIEQLTLVDAARIARLCQVDVGCVLMCIEAIHDENLLHFLVTEDGQSGTADTEQ